MSSERFALAAALILLLAAQPVRAQDEVSAEEQDEVSADQMELARERFMRGLELADAGNCEGALAEFNASLASVRRPSTLYNVARCQEQLNRYDLAILAYREYLSAAPEDDADRARAEATMEQLGRLLGTIHVSSNVPAEVWLGDRVVGESPGDVLVPGGRHVIELRAEGRIPERREVEVSAGADVSVEVELGAAEVHEHITETTNVRVEAPPLHLGLTIAVMGVAVGVLGVGAYFGATALQLSDEARALDPRLPRELDAIDESALFADIFFITGGLVAAAAIVMALLTDWDDEASSAGDQVRVLPIVGLGYAGLRVEGLP